MSTVWPAQGTTIGIDETGNGTYTLIPGVSSFDGLGGGTIAQAKTTVLTSGIHTYRGTIKDPAEFTASVWYDPTDATHKFLFGLSETPSNGPNNYKVTYNTGNTNSFKVVSANISEFAGPTASDVEENLTADITWKGTGFTNSTP